MRSVFGKVSGFVLLILQYGKSGRILSGISDYALKLFHYSVLPNRSVMPSRQLRYDSDMTGTLFRWPWFKWKGIMVRTFVASN